MTLVRIYRKSVAADTFGGLGAAEKIEFNANAKLNEVANIWTSFIHNGSPRGIAEHPNPNQNLSENQDTGLEEIVYEIDYVLSRSDLVGNQFMINLISFKDGPQENIAELPFGLFSIEIDRSPLLNLVSSASQGLKVRDITFDLDEEVPNLTTGTITLVQALEAV